MIFQLQDLDIMQELFHTLVMLLYLSLVRLIHLHQLVNLVFCFPEIGFHVACILVLPELSHTFVGVETSHHLAQLLLIHLHFLLQPRILSRQSINVVPSLLKLKLVLIILGSQLWVLLSHVVQFSPVVLVSALVVLHLFLELFELPLVLLVDAIYMVF